MVFIHILKSVFFRRWRTTVVEIPPEFATLVSWSCATNDHSFMGWHTPEIWSSLYITVLYNNPKKDGLKCDRPMLSSPWIRSGKLKPETAFSDVIYYSFFQIVFPYCSTERFYLNWTYVMPHSIVTIYIIYKFLNNVNNVIELSKFITNYNQQDATFLDLFISTDALHVSGGSSAHHQEHVTVQYSFRYCQPILLLAAIVDEMELHGVPSHPR